jgi:hypothetical protein
MAVLGILCGMAAEARALGPWLNDPRVMVRLSAGRVDRAEATVAEMVGAGVRGIVSWGVCGGLDPALRPGDLVECPADQVFAADSVLADPAAKAAAFAGGARIVDLESGAVAMSGLPGVAIRAVLDEAGFALPAPALVALRHDGKPDIARIAVTVLRRPASLPSMIRLACRHRRALLALGAAPDRIGVLLARLAEKVEC